MCPQTHVPLQLSMFHHRQHSPPACLPARSLLLGQQEWGKKKQVLQMWVVWGQRRGQRQGRLLLWSFQGASLTGQLGTSLPCSHPPLAVPAPPCLMCGGHPGGSALPFRACRLAGLSRLAHCQQALIASSLPSGPHPSRSPTILRFQQGAAQPPDAPHTHPPATALPPRLLQACHDGVGRAPGPPRCIFQRPEVTRRHGHTGPGRECKALKRRRIRWAWRPGTTTG